MKKVPLRHPANNHTGTNLPIPIHYHVAPSIQSNSTKETHCICICIHNAREAKPCYCKMKEIVIKVSREIEQIKKTFIKTENDS